MTPPSTLTFLCLGSGTSHGVPMIGCRCAVCRSADPRNQRTRCSGLVRVGDVALLIDTSTDLRAQALRHGLEHLDAVLYTHAHADHLHGIDDLRSFTLRQRAPLPCYGDAATIRLIRERYQYIFADPELRLRWSIPRLDLRELSGPVDIAGVPVIPVPLLHGRLPVLGFRIGRFAYLTDCSEIPPASWELLRDLHTLVLDGLRPRPHETHFSISQAVDVVARLAPTQAYLTHLTHDVDHGPVEAQLPAGVRLAYDGLQADVPF
jgi:phosphoribosyl 1,2-cyclic phosphate phosphodiesterase